MAVYQENSDGTIECIVPDKTLTELHNEVQAQNALNGLDTSSCVQDTLKQVNTSGE